MRQLILLFIVVLNLNSYCQEYLVHYNLLTVDDSMPFRLKKVELFANRIFGPEITKENYFMFEFPNDTSTLLIFANRTKKQTVKRNSIKELQVSQLSPNMVRNNLLLKYKSKYYQVCTKPNSLMANKSFFTKNDDIFLNGKYFDFTDKNEGDVICEFYGYKYNIPITDGDKVLYKKVTLLSRENNYYIIKYDFQPLKSSIGWTSTIYKFEKDMGIQLQEVDQLYSIVVKQVYEL